MDILERLEHFKDYKYMKKNQEEEIRKQEAIVHACDDMCLPDSLKNRLFQDVQEAKGKLMEIKLEEQTEGQELERFLNENIQDDRIRYILNRHYIQQKSLLEVSKEISLSYGYTKMLSSKGKQMVKKVVIE